MSQHPLAGVYAAVVTPLYPNYEIDFPAVTPLLDYLAHRGCHGALLLGTTGEGPSFSPDERLELCQAARKIREAHPGFKLLAGTGTPSLDETITLTKSAFDLGFDGVVVLPPYYFRKVSDDGLLTWFGEVLRRAVPKGGALFGYHIPSVSGVALSFELVARLKDSFPDKFAGLKDSSADPEHGGALGRRFGDDLLIYCGTDSLFQSALDAGAQGCITAPANLLSPFLRQVWDAHATGGNASAANALLQKGRAILDAYPPAPATLKAILHHLNGFPNPVVRPPLLPTSNATVEKVIAELREAGIISGG
ncbi:MAG: dihydrodipicolinate synthase family protein [Chloroflexi bacterium]|nr:dihydrodipicolinate synthase family protein [Chloroflexota bacterium]